MYRIAGNFPEVQIFPDFPNGLMTRENLFWTLERLDCGIEICNEIFGPPVQIFWTPLEIFYASRYVYSYMIMINVRTKPS